jgi:hypothetical protein
MNYCVIFDVKYIEDAKMLLIRDKMLLKFDRFTLVNLLVF